MVTTFTFRDGDMGVDATKLFEELDKACKAYSVSCDTTGDNVQVTCYWKEK